MFQRLARFFSSRQRHQAGALYAALVAQSRRPALYRDYAIPDTLDGRFDSVVLHLFLVLRRLNETGQAGLTRLLQEAFISDMDRSLRELGVGDTGVGRRVKQMVAALRGRIKSYEAAWESDEALGMALSTNLYAPGLPEPAQVSALVDYLRRNNAMLAQQAIEALREGRVEFTD